MTIRKAGRPPGRYGNRPCLVAQA